MSTQSERPEANASFGPMTPADIDRVLIVERAAYGFPWSQAVFRDCLSAGYSCWLLEQGVGRQLHGFAIMSTGAGEAHILNLCIHPDRQRCGFGHQLLNHLRDVAGSSGVRRLLLEVRPSNTAAVALYARAGFSVIGIRKGYYPATSGREDAAVMALDLPSDNTNNSETPARPLLARP